MDLAEIYAKHKLSIKSGSAIADTRIYFHPKAQLIHLGCGLMATGIKEVAEVNGQCSSQQNLIIEEKVISTVIGDNQVVEETILCLEHEEIIPWLLPSVKPTGREATILMVTIATFDVDGMITSKKLLWDQGSLLKQIAVLPKTIYCKDNSQEVFLPIVGHEIAYKSLNLIATTEDCGVEELTLPVEEEPKPEIIRIKEEANKRAELNAPKQYDLFDSGEPMEPRRPLYHPVETPDKGIIKDEFGLAEIPSDKKPSRAPNSTKSKVSDVFLMDEYEDEDLSNEMDQVFFDGGSEHDGAGRQTHPTGKSKPTRNYKAIEHESKFTMDDQESQDFDSERVFKKMDRRNTKRDFQLGDELPTLPHLTGKLKYVAEAENPPTIPQRKLSKKNREMMDGFSLCEDEAPGSNQLTRKFKRDPNAQSQTLSSNSEKYRPLSKAVQDPGGKSNFSLS